MNSQSPAEATSASETSAGGGSTRGIAGVLGLLRQSGPAFLAGGLNIGTATVANSVLLAAATGFVFGWVFGLAIVAIVVATVACVKISTITQQDPIEVIRTRVHPSLGWVNGIAMLIVNVVFHTVNALLAGLAVNALIPGISIRVGVVVAVGIAACLVLFARRARFAEQLLKFLLFGLGGIYLVALFVVPVDWGGFFTGVFSFSLPTTQPEVLLFTAVLGSTLAVTVPVIQAYGSRAEGYGTGQLGLVKFETTLVNLLQLFVMVAVMLVVASTLFPQGILVTNAIEAGSALEPVAGPFATIVFATGLLGAAITTLMVQTQVSGFIVSDLVGWKRDVGSYRFKAVQAATLVCALIVAIFGLDPFEWVAWGAAINSTFVPIVIATWWWLINRRSVMGKHRAGKLMNIGLAVTMLIGTAAATRFWYVTLFV